MRAERIIVENGKAIDVRAIDRFGSTYDYRGTKGIIIATGGYSNNKEMR